nr:thaumatin-like protein [Setaria viridis]
MPRVGTGAGAGGDDADGDRIRALPDGDLLHALGFLPARDAVRTCVLGRLWGNQWRALPRLRITGAGARRRRREAAHVREPAGPAPLPGRIWGRTGCSFNNNGRGRCQTGDCAGALSCTLSGQPPLTLAEFTLGGAQDFYDISVIDGYNLAMAFSCSSGDRIVCTSSRCPQAYLFLEVDNSKVHACAGNSNYQRRWWPAVVPVVMATDVK